MNIIYLKRLIKYSTVFIILLMVQPSLVNASSNCTGYTYVEDNNSILKYIGDWTLDNNSVYGGTNSHGGSHSYTPSGSVELTFKGTEIQFYGKTGPGAGTAKIYLYNMTSPVKTIDQFTDSHTYQKLWYQNTGLSNTEHTIKIETYDKNPSSTGTYLNVDYFIYQNCSPSAPIPVTGLEWPTLFLFGIGISVILGSVYLLI